MRARRHRPHPPVSPGSAPQPPLPLVGHQEGRSAEPGAGAGTQGAIEGEAAHVRPAMRGEGGEFVDLSRRKGLPAVCTSGVPERFASELPANRGVQALRIRQGVAIAVQDGLEHRSSFPEIRQPAVALAHVLLVQEVVRLVDSAQKPDIGVRRKTQPQLHVRGVGQLRVEPARALQQRRAHDDLRRDDRVLPLAEQTLQPPPAGIDRPTPHSRPGRRQLSAVCDPQGVPVDEPGARVRVQQALRAPQGARGQPIVCRQQRAVVAVGPLEQTLVEGGDVPPVGGVDEDLHPRIAGCDLPGHLGAVIR